MKSLKNVHFLKIEHYLWAGERISIREKLTEKIFFSRTTPQGSVDRKGYNYIKKDMNIVRYSQKAKQQIDNLFEIPSSFGSKGILSIRDITERINRFLAYFRSKHYHGKAHIEDVGDVYYSMEEDGKSIIVHRFDWDVETARYNTNPNNFRRYSTENDIMAKPSSAYKEYPGCGTECTNGYKVVYRKVRGNKVYNFVNTKGEIVSPIDFTEVKPFRDGENARGYTRNHKCYE